MESFLYFISIALIYGCKICSGLFGLPVNIRSTHLSDNFFFVSYATWYEWPIFSIHCLLGTGFSLKYKMLNFLYILLSCDGCGHFTCRLSTTFIPTTRFYGNAYSSKVSTKYWWVWVKVIYYNLILSLQVVQSASFWYC